MKKCILAAAIFSLAFGVQANADTLTVDSSTFIGYFYALAPPAPSNDPQNDVDGINALITLSVDATNEDDLISNVKLVRSGNDAPTEEAVLTDAVLTADELTEGANTIELGDTVVNYITAKYDGLKGGVLVWYSEDGFTGSVSVQPLFNNADPVADPESGQYAVSHIRGFNPDDPVVPEPASIALMGLGGLLAGYGVRRRKQKAQELVS